MYEELKRKMGEFAEFRYEPDLPYYYSKILVGEDGSFIKEEKQIGYWVKDGMAYRELPDFPESLDACFKWLVPKAIDEIMAEQGCSSDAAYAILFKKWLQKLELIIPKTALAFCLAIEKLIDKEAK